MIETAGTNLWFEKDDAWWAEKLGLPQGVTRCHDTLDVWIDSGSSHVAVMDRHPELRTPADLYLEATDQHRGWFQSSLMISVAVRGTAPYKAVLTHGFVVDQDKKKKLSKSEAEKAGKPIDAAHFYEKYGADILRLWVSSVDWQNEVPFGEDLFQQTAEPYRRFRNVLRILLANLDDFDADRDAVSNQDLTLIDRWVLERLNSVIRECREAYADYEFRKVFNVLNQFCAVDLSALYVDIAKDRMYCDATDSVRRRATQTAMRRVFDALARLLAPILAYTADEAWEFAGNEGSVHLEKFPETDEAFAGSEATGQSPNCRGSGTSPRLPLMRPSRRVLPQKGARWTDPITEQRRSVPRSADRVPRRGAGVFDGVRLRPGGWDRKRTHDHGQGNRSPRMSALPPLRPAD